MNPRATRGIHCQAIQAKQHNSLLDQISGRVIGEVGWRLGQGAGANPARVVGFYQCTWDSANSRAPKILCSNHLKTLEIKNAGRTDE